MKFIGDNLRKFRVEAGFSRDDLAKKIIKDGGRSINPRTLENWEKDGSKPDADSLAQISMVLNKDLYFFFAPVTYQSDRVGKQTRKRK